MCACLCVFGRSLLTYHLDIVSKRCLLRKVRFHFYVPWSTRATTRNGTKTSNYLFFSPILCRAGRTKAGCALSVSRFPLVPYEELWEQDLRIETVLFSGCTALTEKLVWDSLGTPALPSLCCRLRSSPSRSASPAASQLCKSQTAAQRETLLFEPKESWLVKKEVPIHGS